MDPLTDLIGKSAAADDLRAKVYRLLQRRHAGGRFPPILIEGETGTGKGLVAQLIHRAGPRAAGPFVSLNCAAIPETLLESELFGFERGAFTDARRAKRGLFQSAHRGVLFLDEIGELSHAIQTKLLTAIEERWVRALGRTQREDIDVWIVAATNADLAAGVRDGRFREDLYHRLAVLKLHVPPLRERRDDILPLAEHFLEVALQSYGLPERRLTDEARAALVAYPWPGNVREVLSVMDRVALLSDTPEVTAAMLGLGGLASPVGRAEPHDEAPMEETIAHLERGRIVETLDQVGWNITEAAARLGLTRNKLRYRIDKYRLSPGTSGRRRSGTARRKPGTSAAAVAESPALEPRHERRRLAILRADVDVRDAGEAALYGPAATMLFREKVESFGGRVEGATAHGIVAVFGLEAVDDAARRAVHTAMAMRRAHALLEAVGRRGPDTKIAVHVAEVAVVFDADRARIDAESARPATAVCDALIDAAPAGAIVVSDQAARVLERRFSLAPSGPGMRLVGHERSGLGVAGQMTRFVGRDDDLRFLESRVAVAARGHGQVLGIAGEAGIGKSRLLRELRQSLRGRTVTVLRGHCLPYGRSIPYFLVSGILRHTLRVTERDGPRKVTERVSRTLRELGIDAACGPFLLHLLGVRDGAADLAALSDEAIKTGMLDVLRQMLLNGSRVQPILYITEDLHWIDRASEDALAFLVDHLADTPILLIATYRPGYRPPWADRSYATQIALQPLSDADAFALVRSLSPGAALPEGLARAIVARAEGNPFFLEELTRVGWDGADVQDERAIPETVQDVVRARLDRLAEPARRLLQTAAVLGREFSPALAAKLWGAPVDVELAELVRVEFLREEGRGSERVYVFKHGLMHEVAYEAVPPDERRALHENAARALMEVYAERVAEAYERLAYHYSRADDHARAVEYLTLSAERAVRSYAHEEAVRALQQALRHAARLPAAEHTEPLLDVALRLASSLIPLGRFQDALDLLLQHEERLERLDRPALAGRYYFLVGRAASFLGSYEHAASAAQRAIAEATRCGDAATTGKAYSVLAMDAPMSGHTRQGIEFAQRAIALLDGTSERWWLGHTHWALGINYTQIGEFVAALEAEGKAYAIGEAMGDARLQTYASWVTGVVYAVVGEAQAAIEACRRALDRAPDPFNREIARGFLGYAHLERGDVATAIPLLERAIQRLGEFRYRPFQGWFTVFLAEALRQGNELEKALDVAQQGVVIARDSGFQVAVGWAQQVLGRIAHQQGHVATAAALLVQARETFTALHSRYELGRTSMDMALVAESAGDRAGAAIHLNAAHQVFVALHVPKYLERVSRLAHDLGIPLGART